MKELSRLSVVSRQKICCSGDRTMHKYRARAIAIAEARNKASLRLSLFVLAVCATAALLALPGLF
jgi:hypothetical protein